MVNPIVYLISMLLSLYSWVVLIWIILSWLTAFNIINHYNPFVSKLLDVLHRLTEPALRPLRKILPPIAGIDLSPILLFVAIHFVDYTIRYLFIAL